MEDEPTRFNAKDVLQSICRSPNMLYFIIAPEFSKPKQINCLFMPLFLLAEYSSDSAAYTKTSALHQGLAA